MWEADEIGDVEVADAKSCDPLVCDSSNCVEDVVTDADCDTLVVSPIAMCDSSDGTRYIVADVADCGDPFVIASDVPDSVVIADANWDVVEDVIDDEDWGDPVVSCVEFVCDSSNGVEDVVTDADCDILVVSPIEVCECCDSSDGTRYSLSDVADCGDPVVIPCDEPDSAVVADADWDVVVEDVTADEDWGDLVASRVEISDSS